MRFYKNKGGKSMRFYKNKGEKSMTIVIHDFWDLSKKRSYPTL